MLNLVPIFEATGLPVELLHAHVPGSDRQYFKDAFEFYKRIPPRNISVSARNY